MSQAQFSAQERRAIQSAVANDKIGANIAGKIDGTLTAGTLPHGTAAQISVDEQSAGVWHQTTITLTAFPITITDDGTEAYGGQSIYTHPQGNIKVEGAVLNLTSIDGTGVSGITTTFGGKMAVGTATAAAATSQTGTSANILASNNNAAAVATIATNKTKSTTTLTPFDGTTTTGNPISHFLNANITYANQSGGGTLKVTGTYKFLWANLGDI